MAEIEVSIKGIDGEFFTLEIPFCDPGEVKTYILIKLNGMGYNSRHIELEEQETCVYTIKCDLFVKCKETFGDFPNELNLDNLLYEEEDIDNCKLLIDLGANINFKSGYTTIEHACYYDNEEKLYLLMSSGAHFNKNNNETLLHIAAKNGSINMVRYLLDGIFAIDVVDEGYETPVIVASRSNNHEMIEFLFENGATNDPDPYGFTPIYHAVKNNEVVSVETLIKLGATNAAFENGNTLFHIAGEHASNPVLEVLMEAFPTGIYDRNDDNETIMHVAVEHNDKDMIKLLTETEGETPLTMAMRTGKQNMVKALLDAQNDLFRTISIYKKHHYK